MGGCLSTPPVYIRLSASPSFLSVDPPSPFCPPRWGKKTILRPFLSPLFFSSWKILFGHRYFKGLDDEPDKERRGQMIQNDISATCLSSSTRSDNAEKRLESCVVCGIFFNLLLQQQQNSCAISIYEINFLKMEWMGVSPSPPPRQIECLLSCHLFTPQPPSLSLSLCLPLKIPHLVGRLKKGKWRDEERSGRREKKHMRNPHIAPGVQNKKRLGVSSLFRREMTGYNFRTYFNDTELIF